MKQCESDVPRAWLQATDLLLALSGFSERHFWILKDNVSQEEDRYEYSVLTGRSIEARCECVRKQWQC